MLAGQRIGEGQTIGQQLQRGGVIIGRMIQQIRVEPVMQNPVTQRGKVDTQLVGSPGFRSQC